MTGKEIVAQWRKYGMLANAVSFGSMVVTIDAALAAERDRCAKIIWEYRGMFVFDESARALMAEVRRER